MKFAWKGTFEALMVKFGGEIGTLYQIFTPCVLKNTPCKIGQMFKRKGGGSKAFWTMLKKLHFSYGTASLICQEYIITSHLKVAATKRNEKYLLKMGIEFYLEIRVQ